MDSGSDRPSAQRWRRIQDLFDDLVELPVEERARRLRERCPADSELHRRVESLLAAHDRTDEVLHALEHPDAVTPETRHGGGSEAGDPYRLIGRVVSHYRVVEVLGGGGMGVVYRAEDLRLGRSVALKFLSPFRSNEPGVNERFLREAQAASALDHPNICAIHEVGESEDGSPYIAMPCYEGESLREKIAAGPIPFGLAIDLAIQVAEGLAAVHRHGIVHRDIKPGNLIVSEDGVTKILDFGLAKVADVTLSQTGRTMGTVAYMSPEQARGGAIDARTDLWSLGVVIYEMITGQRPFGGAHEQSVIYSILNQEPDPPRTLCADTPEPFERVVLALLRKDPAARYQSAEALLADLRAVRAARDPPILARGPDPARTRIRRRRWVMAAAALLVLTSGMLGVVKGITGKPRSPATTPATPIRRSTVAVLPFTVTGGPDLAFLKEGMIDLLSLKLEASGRLRSVSPGPLWSHLEQVYPGGLDPAKYHRDVPGGGWAAETAEHFLAEYFIVGTISSATGPVQLSASVYTPRWWEPVVTVGVEAQAESGLLDAIEELADRLVARLAGPDDVPVPRLAALMTASLPALRAYLEGLQADRRSDQFASNELMRRAVAIDSTFALAWFTLASNRRNFGGGAELGHALALGESLPPHQRAHLDAYKAFLDGRASEAEKLYRRIVARHNDDIDAWRMLGDVLVLYNGFYGRPIAESRDAFDRVLTLDPHDSRVTYRLLDIAALEGEVEEFDSLSTLIADRLSPGTTEEHLYRILPGLTGAERAERAAVFAELGEIGSEERLRGIAHYARILLDLPTLLRLNRSKTDPSNLPGTQARAHQELAFLESARGRFEAARLHLDTLAGLDPAWALVARVYLATLPYAPVSAAELNSLAGRLASWDTTSPPLMADTHIGGWADLTAYMQGLLSFRQGDTGNVRAVVKGLKERGASQARGIPAVQMASTLEALMAWKRNEPRRALSALDAARVDLPLRLRDSPLHSRALNRYLRGEVLYGEGRYQDALPWFESLYPGVEEDVFIWPYVAPAQLRIAEIHERLGDRAEAEEHYRRFRELWRDCDSELRPMVEEAGWWVGRLTTSGRATLN